MSMLDVHKDALADINEGYHTFLLRYKKEIKTVYGIVEGKDDPMFYRSLIERSIPENWTIDLIPAGQRKKVIEIHEILDWSVFSPFRIAFFIDSDLHSIIGSQSVAANNIYVTDCYSIENAIVTPHVFLRLLVEVYNIVDYTNDEEEKLISLFKDNLENFQKMMTPIMAQILGWRRDSIKANLSNLDFKHIFKFDNGQIFITQEFKEEIPLIDHLCGCVGANRYNDGELAALKARFCANSGPSRYIRGKYLLWFLSNFSTHIHRNISTFVSAYKKSPKVKIEMGTSNIMVIAAPRARIPESLRIFIERTYVFYINNIDNHCINI